MTLHAKNLEIIDGLIASITGQPSNLTTTDTSNIVAAVNELQGKIDALGTVEHEGADITARNSLTDLIKGDKVFVVDASADTTVTSGWAIYRYAGTGVSGAYVDGDFLKITEQEALDVALVVNLSQGTVDGTTFEVAIDTGTNVTITSATATDAGLMSAADKVILDQHEVEIAEVNAFDYTTYINANA